MTHFSAIGICLVGILSSSLIGCGDGETKPAPKDQGTGGSGEGGKTGASGGTAGTTAATCTASFVLPTNGAILTEASDVSGALCANGFFYDVIVATDAPNGTAATLTVGSGASVSVTVQNAVAKFASAQLGTSGTQNLSVKIGGTALSACTATETVSVNCLGHSACSITSPVISATHVALNGVTEAQGGDRVSSVGSPYQAAFEVTTDIEDGQPVSLVVSDGTTTNTVLAEATAGKASFPGVTFIPDGTYTATASCQARSGVKATSSPLSVPVDTAGPDLTVAKGTGAAAATMSALADGDHFSAADDSDAADGLQLKICGTTAATDALGIDAAVFGALANNFCVSTGGNTPVCTPALASTGNAACVNFPCPGGGVFDLTVTLKDEAQNPVTVTRRNLTCASTNPIVAFQDPVSGGTGADPTSFTDQSLRILAASATGATQKKDKTAATLGAQYDVVVCTSAPAGSSAKLSQGWYAGTLAPIATATVAADTGNLCQGSQPSVALFSNVTLNESTVKSNFTLDKATQLQATVTDLNFGVGTATIDVWVDSVVPSLSLVTPANFCGSYVSTAGVSTQSLTFGTAFGPVVATVTPNAASALNYTSATTPTFSQLVIPGVAFPQGISQLVAIVAKPSGNVGVFPSGSACTVTVGTSPPPIVTWAANPAGTAPVVSSLLTAPGNTIAGAVADSDSATPGWQGTLRACANITGSAATGVTLQFSVNGTDVAATQAIDSTTGCAAVSITGANVVPEGPSVQLSARTNALSSGIGVGSINVPVDVTKPATPVNLVAVTKDRRQTSFTLSWNLPEGGNSATDYDVRVAKAIIDDATKFNAAEVVAFNGIPQVPGVTDSVDVTGRLIENGYFFAIQATDDVGNRSDFAYTATAKTDRYSFTELLPPVSSTNFGWSIDGSGDISGDTYADLVVGSAVGTNVYIYFGSATGYATSPSVTIQGSTAYFGSALSIVGDINKDGILDLAIGSPREGGGAVYIYHGRTTWPSLLTSSGANAVATVDSVADSSYATAQFGLSLARLGDFNSDGVDDVAIGAPYYNAQPAATNQGQVIILYGKAGGLAPAISLPGSFGLDATRIDGDPTTFGKLGFWVVGSGYFYGSTLGTGLIAAAPFTTTAGGAYAGRLYSFEGRTGTAASIAYTTARNTLDGTVALGAVGANGLAPLGDIGPGGQSAFGIPFLSATSSFVQFCSGTVAEGPFGEVLTVNTAESSANRVFARFVAGGGISGSAATMSLIGSARSDVAVSTQASGIHRIFVVDGTRIGLSGTTNIESISDVVVTLPDPSTGTWQEAARQVGLIRDANGDGYTDIAVGDVTYGSSMPDGRVIILQ